MSELKRIGQLTNFNFDFYFRCQDHFGSFLLCLTSILSNIIFMSMVVHKIMISENPKDTQPYKQQRDFDGILPWHSTKSLSQNYCYFPFFPSLSLCHRVVRNTWPLIEVSLTVRNMKLNEQRVLSNNVTRHLSLCLCFLDWTELCVIVWQLLGVVPDTVYTCTAAVLCTLCTVQR